MNPRIRHLLDEIRRAVTRPMKVMEVCGGQTHAIAAQGVEELLPPQLRLIHGPGCPVCVTAVGMIDRAVELCLRPNVVLCTYGDMMRVPGSRGDLLTAKAHGGNVYLIYSPTEAVQLAVAHPEREVVLFAVGFETTAPASALAVRRARALGLNNFSVLCAHVAVPPCLEWLMEQEDGSRPDAFLAPGHVCAVTGEGDYTRLAEKFRTPMVITGFQVEDILRGLLLCVRQLTKGEGRMQNAYQRWVKPQGNVEAQAIMRSVLEPEAREWRGLGLIPKGGLKMRLAEMDAMLKLKCRGGRASPDEVTGECLAGQVLRGLVRPTECPCFGTSCTPLMPMGAPMVSGEGACAAYYKYKRN